MSCWNNPIYKGEDIELSIPFTASGYTALSASFFTTGETKVSKDDFTVSGGFLTVGFQDDDLDLLPDGVLRYKFEYKIDGLDNIQISNTPYFLKTPSAYSAETREDIFESGYTSGFTDGVASGSSSAFTLGYTSGKTDGIAGQKSKLSAITITANSAYTYEDGYSSVTVNVTGSEWLGYLTNLEEVVSQYGQFAITDGYGGVELCDLGQGQQAGQHIALGVLVSGTTGKVEIVHVE